MPWENHSIIVVIMAQKSMKSSKYDVSYDKKAAEPIALITIAGISRIELQRIAKIEILCILSNAQ